MPGAAQTHANGLAVESTDPQQDAAIIAEMRARMDRIHREEKRPTVGLVLSGGGAKGAAHVGVLRYLQEKEIPVDAIFGTSMGGLIGGLASLGYSPDYMDSLLRSQDWGVMLTDRIDRSYYSYQRKMYKETYLLSIPFMYADRDFQTRIDEQVRYGSEKDSRSFGRNSFVNSLPSGYVYGFNVNNLILTTFNSHTLNSLVEFVQVNLPTTKIPEAEILKAEFQTTLIADEFTHLIL